MTFYDVIRKKRDGRELTEEEIALFVRGATDGSIPDYQLYGDILPRNDG